MSAQTRRNSGGPGEVRLPARASGEVVLLPGWWDSLGTTGVIKLLIPVLLMAWLYWGHLYRLYRYWQQPDWSHGFLVPVFCLYVVHIRRGELLTRDHRGSLWGLAVMILSILAYVVGIYMKIGYPQPLSIVSMIVGLVLLLRGWRTLWIMLFPISFLILAIPPPEYLYRDITQPLQQGAAIIASAILNIFPGAEIERNGINILFYMDNGDSGTFTVSGACSGMRSLMAFAALGLGMAYFTPRPAWQRIAIAAVVIPVALSCNILRVVITGGLQMYGHEELATGTAHALLGFFVFGLGFVLYLSILWVFDHVFLETRAESNGRPCPPAGGSA
ncbi:MAG: exosortase/archaeosortase family protein [Dehalococcoidia bacterium]